MAFFYSEALVLRTRVYREADRLVSFLLPTQGKLTALARGVSKPQSRLRACVQGLVHGNYLFYRGRALDTLIQGELLNSFPGWRQDLYRLAYAQYMAEVIEAFALENESNPAAFRLMLCCLNLLEDVRNMPALVSCYLQARLLQQIGYQPQLTVCSRCGRRPPPWGEVYFSLAEGGVVCQDCAGSISPVFPIRQDTLALWRYLEKLLPAHLPRLKIKQDCLDELETILRQYLTYHSGLTWKTPAFLSSLAPHA